MKHPPLRHSAIALAAVLLAGCSSLTPEQNLTDVQQLTEGRTAGTSVTLQRNKREIDDAVAESLKAPLTAESAVRIALLNNPGLHSALAQLDISDAQRVQAGRAPNPHVSIAEYAEGSKLEIERVLRFDVVGLLFLPWKAKWQGQQHELAKLQAAQQVIVLATDTRKAWINTVAAQQTVAYLGQVRKPPKPVPSWRGAWRAWATGANCSRPVSRSSWPMPRPNWRARNRPCSASARSSPA